ncbi:MAG: glycosyltransferase family 2 protein [Salinibacter sp.]
MATALHFALLAPVGLALISSALIYWQGWTYYTGENLAGEESLSELSLSELEVGGTSVIVPLRGIPEGLSRLLDDLLSQDEVQPLEVIVAVEEDSDPAVPHIEKRAEAHDQIRLVVAEENGAEGTGKIANLIAGVSQATHDRFVFVDADVHLWPGAVRDLLRPLSDPSVGIAFAPQVGAGSPNLPAAFSHVFVNDSAVINGAAAYRDDLQGGTGAFMATRRDVLEAVGGLSAFAGQIVMDIPLGQAAKEEGFGLHLLRRPVRVGGGRETWTDVLRRQHRWMVSIRTYVPSFPAFVVGASLPETWSLLFLTTAVLRGDFMVTAAGALGVVLAWKGTSVALANAFLARDEELWPRLWIAFVAELLWLLIFVWSLADTRVYWAGRWFEVGSDGSKCLVEAPTPVS